MTSQPRFVKSRLRDVVINQDFHSFPGTSPQTCHEVSVHTQKFSSIDQMKNIWSTSLFVFRIDFSRAQLPFDHKKRICTTLLTNYVISHLRYIGFSIFLLNSSNYSKAISDILNTHICTLAQKYLLTRLRYINSIQVNFNKIQGNCNITQDN